MIWEEEEQVVNLCHLEESQLEFRNSQFVINYDILMNGKTKIRDFYHHLQMHGTLPIRSKSNYRYPSMFLRILFQLDSCCINTFGTNPLIHHNNPGTEAVKVLKHPHPLIHIHKHTKSHTFKYY